MYVAALSRGGMRFEGASVTPHSTHGFLWRGGTVGMEASLVLYEDVRHDGLWDLHGIRCDEAILKR